MNIDSYKGTEIPVSLLKTWLWLSTESDEVEVQDRCKALLIEAFGDLEKANRYIENHHYARQWSSRSPK